MEEFRKTAIEVLGEIKGTGKYACSYTENFVFPDLEVDGIGEMAFPITESLACALIKTAQKAPFGLGLETKTDTTVRSAWEIDKKHLFFKSEQWQQFINKLLPKVKNQLGIERYEVSASLYKMLIYEKGDFFLSHKDTEKEPGMFGTMVITLPSRYSGGELIVRFEGTEERIDSSTDSSRNKLTVAAFYADCEHEIKPLSSGHRVCLIYNLIQKKAATPLKPSSMEVYIHQLALALTKRSGTTNDQPFILLLNHQYTPENFSVDSLKLNDRHKAEVLLKAAQKAGYYAKLCLVTSYIIGSPEYDDWSGDGVGENIESVIDTSLSIEHWLESDIPGFDNLPFEESDLIASFKLADDEPLIKSSTGYMGNYGPDIEHWYHYGAITIWSQETNAQLLATQSSGCQLNWLKYFTRHYSTISAVEIQTIENSLVSGFKEDRGANETAYDAIPDWLIIRGDSEFFTRIENKICKDYFSQISPSSWIKLLSFHTDETNHEILNRVMLNPGTRELWQLLSLVNLMLLNNSTNKLIDTLIPKLPLYIESCLSRLKSKEYLLNEAALQHILSIERNVKPDKEWIQAITALILLPANRNYFNNVLVPGLLSILHKTALTNELLDGCKKRFEKIALEKPEAPKDWRRKVPKASSDERQWKILKPFLESPVEEVLEFRKIQNERVAMENAIRNADVDLRTETIKKGSPHTLRIIKTQATYERYLNEWKYDSMLLNKIIGKITS